MLALAGGDHKQALLWVEWTRDFNASVFSPERENYYRCLQTLLQLQDDDDGRSVEQYQHAFARLYGAQTLAATTEALAGENPFYGLTALRSSPKRGANASWAAYWLKDN